MRKLTALFVVLLASALLAAAAAPTPQATLPQPDTAPRVARNKLGHSVIVRDIDDPANPYAGQYDATDRWHWEHYAPAITPEERTHFLEQYNTTEGERFRAQYPEHWRIVEVDVDAAGWLIPQTVLWADPPWQLKRRTIREEVLGERDPHGLKRQQDQRLQFHAVGIFGTELHELRNKLATLAAAEQTPLIPAWLGTRPPIQTVFVPNGEILTYGPLNLHLDRERAMITFSGNLAEGERWFRYSSDGRLIHEYTETSGDNSDFRWQDIYADFTAVEQSFHDQGIVFATHFLYGGARAYITRDEPPQLLGVYDYLGNPLDPDLTAPDHRSYGSNIDQRSIEHLFKAQVEAGLVNPNDKSPWEGTPQGPVAVDPTPRRPKLVAQRPHRVEHPKYGYTTAGTDHIVVKALDDPANPYREQYGAWDYWMFEQQGQRNPAEAAFRKQQNAQPKFTNAADGTVKTGGEFEGGGWVPYTPPLAEQWRDFNVHVDEQGWVIPYLQSQQTAWGWRLKPEKWTSMYARTVPGDREYTFHTGGEMPAATRAALLDELRTLLPDRFPPEPPTWMRAAPPYAFLVTPEGEYITEGPLGSWREDWKLRDPAWQTDRRQTRSAHGWYHYSANGELLGSIKGYSWLPLLNARYDELKAAGEAQGYDVMDYFGYLTWMTRRVEGEPFSGGDIARKWDYDDTEVAADLTYYRPGNAMREWSWDSVVRMDRGELPE
jgi:hypothetical protein